MYFVWLKTSATLFVAHHAFAIARALRVRGHLTNPEDSIIVPFSLSGGSADQAKKLTAEAMATLRRHGRPSC